MRIDVFSLLLLVFVLCKAFAVGPIAQWSWVWVLSPLWIPVTFFAVCLIIGVGAAVAREFSK